MDRLRRHCLQLGASLTGALLWPLSDASALTAAEIAERLFRVVKKPSGVDETLLTLLEATVRNHRKRFVLAKDSIYDLHTLSQDVLASLLTLTHLLEHALFTHWHARLCSLAGETAQLLGDIHFSTGHNDQAHRYYDLAVKAAKKAQDETLQAVIAGRTAFVLLYSDKAVEALPLLHQAHPFASTASDPLRAWLLTVEAGIEATVGDAAACYRALAL